MSDDPRLDSLLEQVLDANQSPEEACRSCPELLPEVHRQLKQIRIGDALVKQLFPGAGTEPQQPARVRTDLKFPTADELTEKLPELEILESIGHGGMGSVYKARQNRPKRFVAVKVPANEISRDPESRERFLREANAAASLEHDHIVQIFQVGEGHGIPFIVMPLLQGESLATRLKTESKPKLEMPEVLRIGQQIAAGLVVAHSKGIIHRDIKPGNIWLEGAEGRVKILDFGLARVSAQESVSSEAESIGDTPSCSAPSAGSTAKLGQTQQGTILGTPAYMAPEQAKGEKVDGRCDLWSLGVVLYEMCTGASPFYRCDQSGAFDPHATLAGVMTYEPPAPTQINRDVPVALSNLVMKLLAKDPAQRPATAQEVGESLNAIEAKLYRRRLLMPTYLLPLIRHWPLVGTIAGVISISTLAWFFAATAWQIAMNKGELVIETDDANLLVTVKNQTSTLYDKVADRRLVLPVGEYDVEMREEDEWGMRYVTRKVAVTRGDRETFNARLELSQAKKYLDVDLGGGLIMKMVRVEAGRFMMGSPWNEQNATRILEWDTGDWVAQEKQHEVVITKPFYMGIYEVTQKQFESVIGNRPSKKWQALAPSYAKVGIDTSRFAVYTNSWDEAMEFCKLLSQKVKKAFDLPTEAEWEYACRAGTNTAFHYGDSLSWEQANIRHSFRSPGIKERPNRVLSLNVGLYEPNQFGLYDMHGNVSEWCKDWYKKTYYSDSPLADPQGPDSGEARVVRGGHSGSHALSCRSAFREGALPIMGTHGFRVVLRLP